MDMSESSRLILGLRAKGWNDSEITDFILWIGTGKEQYRPKPENIVPDKEDEPNAETIAAIRELESGGGEVWTGSTKGFFAMLDAEAGSDT